MALFADRRRLKPMEKDRRQLRPPKLPARDFTMPASYRAILSKPSIISSGRAMKLHCIARRSSRTPIRARTISRGKRATDPLRLAIRLGNGCRMSILNLRAYSADSLSDKLSRRHHRRSPAPHRHRRDDGGAQSQRGTASGRRRERGQGAHCPLAAWRGRARWKRRSDTPQFLRRLSASSFGRIPPTQRGFNSPQRISKIIQFHQQC
jgi:hypothetical protein